MKKTNIFLIRHGEVVNPQKIMYGSLVDVPLSFIGMGQIKTLAHQLRQRGISPDAIFSSNLTRAIHSAEIIKEILAPNIQIQQDIRLRDIDHPGLERHTIEWGDTIPDMWNYKGPEMEGVSLERREDLVDRMIASISDIKNSSEGKTALVVSHGHPTAYLMWAFLHPNETNLPLPSDLMKQGIYLGKAEAWHLRFNNGIFVEHERISREGVGRMNKEKL